MAPVLHFILTFKIGRSFHGTKRCSSAGYACVPSTRWDWVTDTPPFGIKQISRGTSRSLFFSVYPQVKIRIYDMDYPLIAGLSAGASAYHTI
jgi:hypothetical protein